MKPEARSSNKFISKVMAPRLHGILARQRLFGCLDAEPERSIIWLAGPGGWGKTSLVAAYLEVRGLPAVWYRCDGRDADPASFFYYFREAIATLAPSAREDLPPLTPDRLPALDHFTRTWFEQAFGHLPAACAIVLDDWHAVENEAAWRILLPAGLAEKRPGLRLFVTARCAPPASLARHRAAGEMLVLEPPTLGFTLDELTALVARSGSSVEPAALLKATRGWPVGISLALESGRPAVSEVVFDYLASEVFSGLVPRDQTLLMTLAMLPPVPLAVIDALHGWDDSALRLADLHRRHLFVGPHGGTASPTYELHELFAAFLRQQSEREISPAGRRELAERASRELVRIGALDEALEVALQAGLHDAVERLVAQLGPALLGAGRFAQLAAWLERIPEPERAARPWLLYWLGVAVQPANPGAAIALLEAALAGFRARRDARGAVIAWAEWLDTLAAGLDVRRMDEGLELLAQLRSELPMEGLDPFAELRLASALFVTLLYRRPTDPELARWAERTLELASRHGDTHRRAHAAFFLAMHAYFEGEVGRGWAALRTLEIPRREVPPFMACGLDYMAGLLHLLGGELSEAEKAARRGLALAAETRVGFWEPMLRCLELYALLGQSRLDEVTALLPEAERAAAGTGPLSSAIIHLVSIWLSLELGRPFQAQEHWTAWSRENALIEYPHNTALLHVARVRIALAQGAIDEARRVLDEVRGFAPGVGAFAHQFGLLWTRAELELRAGSDAALAEAVAEAFAFGRQRGLFASLFWSPRAIGRLCEAALARDVETGYANALIRRHALAPSTPAGRQHHWPAPIRIRALGAIDIRADGAPVALGRRSPRRAIELLLAVLCAGDGLTTARAAELLWPDSDGDSAAAALKVTLHRLRKLLPLPELLMQWGGRLVIDRSRCWTDLDALTRLTEELGSGRTTLDSAAPDAAIAELLDLARGPLGDGLPESGWLLDARDHCRARILVCADALHRRLVDDGDPRRARAVVERLLAADPEHAALAERLSRATSERGADRRAR